MTFNLQREMRSYGLQRDIAKKLECSIAYVSAMYTGKKQPSDDLLKLLGWEREVTTTTKYRKVKK